MEKTEFLISLRTALGSALQQASPDTRKHHMLSAQMAATYRFETGQNDERAYLDQAAKSLLEYNVTDALKAITRYGLGKYPDDEALQVTQATLFLKENAPAKAIALLRASPLSGTPNFPRAMVLAKALIKTDDAKSALEELEPYYESGKATIECLKLLTKAHLMLGQTDGAENMLRTMADIGSPNAGYTGHLAHMYLDRNKPGRAVELLRPFYDRGKLDILIVAPLAEAYIMLGDRESFDDVKGHLSDRSRRDYLDAKLSYHEGRMDHVRTLLQPYVNEAQPRDDILGLYMASTLGEDTLTHDHMKAALGAKHYERLISAGQKWHQNTKRTGHLPESPGHAYHLRKQGI